MKTLGLPAELPRNIRLLSLDVFDTALRRTFSQPDHLFCHVEEELEREGSAIRDFARLRSQAEGLARHTARQAHSAPEITLASIYSHMQTAGGISPALLERAKAIEIATELASARADPRVQELFGQAKAAGLPVVFVSDMYLPRSVIETMLAENGYTGYLDLFLSSERLRTKAEGSLFADMLALFELAPERVLHIGDNDHADTAMPRSFGMRCALYGHRRQDMAKAGGLSPHILPLSRRKAAHWPPGLTDSDTGAFFDYLGRTHGALIHGSFARWIAESALANRNDLVLFFSRDGHLLKRIYDLFRRQGAPLPPSAYCCLSRYTARMADLTSLDESAFQFLLSGMQPRTAGQFLARTGVRLAPERADELLAKHGLAPDAVANRDAENIGRMRRLLTDLETPLFLEASRRRVHLEAYLKRFDFSRFKRLAVVDLGWAGNLQAGFEAAIRRLGFTGDVNGYYLGLLDFAQSRRVDGHIQHAFLEESLVIWDGQSRRDPRRFVPIGTIILLELLHAAPHGGVCGYEHRHGAVRPCFVDNAVEKRQYAEKLAVYQEAVLRELSAKTMTDPDFSRDVCLATVLDLCMRPSRVEAAILGDLIHFDAVEHVGDGQPIAPRAAPDASGEQLRAAFEAAYWKAGFLTRNRLHLLEEGPVPLDQPPRAGSVGPAAPDPGAAGPLPGGLSRRRGGRAPRQLLVLSHDFTRTGAPLLLLSWLRWLRAHTDWEFRIIHLWGGELLPQFEALGPVRSFHEDIARPDLDRRGQIGNLKAFCPETVHLVYANTAFCAEMYDLLAELGAPIVTVVHELEHVLRNFVGSDRLAAMTRHTTRYIAGAGTVRDNLVSSHGVDQGRIDVVHEYIDPTVRFRQLGQRPSLRKALGIPDDAVVVLGCGGVEWRKGPDLFIEVARLVRSARSERVVFRWVGGPGIQPMDVAALVAERRLADTVQFVGAKATVKDSFLAGDVYLLTSREDCCPIAALEAAECGLPLLCFEKAGDLPAFITPDIGSVVRHEDPAAMAEALAGLIADPAKRRSLGLAARRKVLSTHVADRACPMLLQACLKALPKDD